MNIILVSLVAAVTFAECPKCDKRMRIAADGKSATLNLSRIAADDLTSMSNRAERLLHFADDVGRLDFHRPLMGWSSWNTFAVDISEELILSTAQAMATNGLAAAGYRYVNIDDGFFGGRDAEGRLQFHPTRFPRGLKATVDGIHALGLKAGIYSEGGTNTCGSLFNADTFGATSGLYGHDREDCELFFGDLGFDFIKVDFCGGRRMHLDERQRYSQIASAIRATGREVRFNVCRWAFPGTWVAEIAESWRTTEDIRASWASVSKLIRENLHLGAYSRLGHYNDMDMLEVGRRKGELQSVFGKTDTGLTEAEEIAHFGMWCMLSSPLLIGCDVRTMPEFTRKLVTNRYLLAMNQNDLGVQGCVVARQDEAYLLVKDAERRYGPSRFAALVNLGDTEVEFKVEARTLDLGGRIAAFDLYERADIGEFEHSVVLKLPAHSARFLLLDAERRLERWLYEAEDAYLSTYQELEDPQSRGTPDMLELPGASGGTVVMNLGGIVQNDLIWKDVRIDRPGKRKLSIHCAAPCVRELSLSVDGDKPVTRYVHSLGGSWQWVDFELELATGMHEVRLFAQEGCLPVLDCMRIEQ